MIASDEAMRLMTSWINDDVLMSNVLLVAAVLVLCGSLRFIRDTHAWLTRVIKTEGEIVDCIEGEDDDGVTYRAIYRYAGIRNDIIGGNHTGSLKPVIGERAGIWYDRSNPANAFLEGSKAIWALPGCTVLVGLALLIGAILVRFNNS